MMSLFFPPANRILRKQFWFAQIGYYAIYAVAALVTYVIYQFIPNESTQPGGWSVSGAASIPLFVINGATALFCLISGIMVLIKRLHDRDRSGFFFFIVLIPLVGPIWLLIETGFLAGTPGSNRFGPYPGFGGMASTSVDFAPVNAPSR